MWQRRWMQSTIKEHIKCLLSRFLLRSNFQLLSPLHSPTRPEGIHSRSPLVVFARTERPTRRTHQVAHTELPRAVDYIKLPDGTRHSPRSDASFREQGDCERVDSTYLGRQFVNTDTPFGATQLVITRWMSSGPMRMP